MPGVVPFIPLIAAGAGMVASNAQNKSNQAAQQNAQNQAEAYQTQQTQMMLQAQQQRQEAAMKNLQQYLQQNPNPVNGWGPIVGPMNTAPATVGGGTIGSNGSPQSISGGGPMGDPNLPALLYALMHPQQQQQQHTVDATTQPVARRPADEGPERAMQPNLNQGGRRAYL